MFVVFNKGKICSYLVSLGTVMVLFVMAIAITNRNEKLIETSTNLIIENNIAKNEYNIDRLQKCYKNKRKSTFYVDKSKKVLYNRI